jgi:hypothetical protein
VLIPTLAGIPPVSVAFVIFFSGAGAHKPDGYQMNPSFLANEKITLFEFNKL